MKGAILDGLKSPTVIFVRPVCDTDVKVYNFCPLQQVVC